MTGSDIRIDRPSRYLLPPLMTFLLYVAISMGISALSVSESFGATATEMLLVFATWLVLPVALVIYSVWKMASKEWRSAFSGLAAIGFIVGISPLLSIINLEIRLAERMSDYRKRLSELPLAESNFHAFDWGGWAGGKDQFFIYTSNPLALLRGKAAPVGNFLQWSNRTQMEAVYAGRFLRLRATFFYCNPFANCSN